MKTSRKVAIIGGARIPFARHNTNYVEASNIAAGAKQLALHRQQTGRAGRTLISMCGAGGLGVTAILEGR